jgi:aspartyl-tRNA synthetase
MKRIYIRETSKYVGQSVKVCGWVNIVRSHGKIIFIDLRDRTGVLQMVCIPQNDSAYNLSKEVRPEWVIEAEGKISGRPEKMVNPKIETGKVELIIEKIEVLSQAKTLPFAIDGPGYDINEEIRMKYRYLDLRRERMKRNLIMRHKVISFIREFLSKEDFVEIETPILTKSTPEGSRDFIVPSRLQPGKFYALPQSPQQYKQLLQVAGFERYFQIARCLRDEDPRGNRQVEHTQLDIEMSFVERENVMNLIENLFIALIKNLYPDKKIQEIPFPRITHKEAMEKYNTDKPDVRKDKSNQNSLAFCWVIDFPFFEKTEEGGWTFTHNPFSAPKPEFMRDLLNKKDIEKILTTQYDIILNGEEVGGGSIRNHRPEALERVFEIMGYKKEEIREKFGHMLTAFEYGAPPHGGIAPGIDRILSILHNEPDIREVIAFPKTGDGRDLMMGAPSEVTKEQLKELRLEIEKTPKENLRFPTGQAKKKKKIIRNKKK